MCFHHSNLSIAIHSLQELSLRLQHSHIFFFRRTLFANWFFLLYYSFQHFISFLICIDNFSSTLKPPTDTHSHHKLTTHTLYPKCIPRGRIQILWLLNMYNAILYAKTEAETKACHKTLDHYIRHQNNKSHDPSATFNTSAFASLRYADIAQIIFFLYISVSTPHYSVIDRCAFWTHHIAYLHCIVSINHFVAFLSQMQVPQHIHHG